MSKQVRWQVPFAAHDGTRYRVDIYDEGYTGNPVVLTAGETPFTTDEDDSDDFFAPVRTQTGTLQVCTDIEGSSTPLKLEDILPANNIARPVRLLKYANGSYSVIEWQGFLSCEAYSQDYIGIPQNLDLPLIGVLEAMDSIEVELSESMAFKKILGHVAYAMKAIETKSGMTLFDQVYIASYVKTALTTQYFYNNVYFSTEEQISGDNITVDVHSISCKAILEQVAKFFGCCWREKGQNIYLQSIGKYSYAFHSFGSIYNAYVAETTGIVWLTAQGAVGDLEDCDWMGNGHQRSVTQGMRRVKVTVKLKDFECKASLQECPVGSLVENPSARQSSWGEVHVNTNETFYSLAEHKHMEATVTFDCTQEEIQQYDPEGGFWYETVNRVVASAAFKQNVSTLPYLHTMFWENTPLLLHWYSDTNPSLYPLSPSHRTVDSYITSFMTWWRDRENELQSGLMVYGLPAYASNEIENNTFQYTNNITPSASNYVFRQRTGSIFSASSGYIKLNVETLAVGSNYMMDCNIGTYPIASVWVAVRFGDKWAYKDGSTYKWSSSFQSIQLKFKPGDGTSGKLKTDGNWDQSMGFDETDGLFIPITSQMVGEVSVYVYPKVTGYSANGGYSSEEVFMMLIGTLDVEYMAKEEDLRTDRSENVYATETSQAFRDELSVDCELASYANNTKLATMIWNDSTTPAKLISLGGATVRPEVDLLNRLATYYGAARQRLELEVAHITTPLPMLRLNGIGDGKVYLPLAESRDWRTGVCKLTCFECPS